MAGGKYTSMNKIIPGAYFAMQKQATEPSLLSPNGILAWVAPQPWGDTVTEVSLDDYTKDNCYIKIGRHNTDSNMVIFGQYCNTLICVNPAQNRARASATIREPAADGTDLYMKVGIKPTAPTLPSNLFSLGVSVSSDSLVFAMTKTGDDEVPAGYNKTRSLEDLVNNVDDVYVVELYKKVDSDYVLVSDADAYMNISGSLSESLSAALTSNNIKWFGPSDASGSLRCQRQISGLYANAQKLGTLGNDISIVVVALSDGRREVRTTVGGVVVDRQRISSWQKFVDNDYIALSGEKTGQPSVTSGINLSGGSDGVVDPDQILSAAWTDNGVDYRFVGIENNINVDGLSLSPGSGSIQLKNSIGSIVASVSYSSAMPHVLNFDLEDGTVLELKLQDVSGNDISDSTTVAAPAAELALSGGNHGVILGLDPAIDELKDAVWNVAVCDNQSEIVNKALFNAIESLGEESGKYRRMVHCMPLGTTTPMNPYNSRKVVYLQQAFNGDASMTAFCIAAIEAGKTFAQSATYQPVPLDGDPDIILTDPQLEDFIEGGVMPISKRDDGLWCITKDIDSLYELDSDTPEILKKNRASRCLDTFQNSCKYSWETKFAGRVTNNESGRSLWQDEVFDILSAMAAEEGIEPVSASDIIVIAGDNPESVITQTAFTIYDSMEIVYIQMAF